MTNMRTLYLKKRLENWRFLRITTFGEGSGNSENSEISRSGEESGSCENSEISRSGGEWNF